MWVEEQIEELGPNHQDEELLQTEQCLHEVRTLLYNVNLIFLREFIAVSSSGSSLSSLWSVA